MNLVNRVRDMSKDVSEAYNLGGERAVLRQEMDNHASDAFRQALYDRQQEIGREASTYTPVKRFAFTLGYNLVR